MAKLDKIQKQMLDFNPATQEELQTTNTQLAEIGKVDLPTVYKAAGDGTTNDTTAFTNLENDIKGQPIDLHNKTYFVNAIPKKNAYHNGVFKVGSYERVSAMSESFLSGVPKRHVFGGQLEKLKYALSNPLEQFIGIVFVGDSITWGMSLPENNAIDPRDGTLSDPRDFYDSPSYVNNVKRYIRERYAYNATPIKSNWSASPSGEAITTFEREIILHPDGGDFTNTTSGSVTSAGSISSSGSLTGYQFRYNIQSVSDGQGVVSFKFTGDSFTLSIDSVVNSMKYELFVDGVSKGVFSTVPGEEGMVAGFDNRRKHTFSYVRSKLIEIKTVKSSYEGLQTLKIGGIIINKKIRITNQGIIGATAKSYRERNLTGNTSGDGVALDNYDNFAFVQFGANDRLISSSYPRGSNEFKKNLKLVIDDLKAKADLILMVSNPVANESTSSFSFNMQDARNVVYSLAKENSLDMIDNYTVFEDFSVNNSVTADGLHPNKFGFQVTSRNIINSLETS
jgi:lysophospholipase L1-like esterase